MHHCYLQYVQYSTCNIFTHTIMLTAIILCSILEFPSTDELEQSPPVAWASTLNNLPKFDV